MAFISTKSNIKTSILNFVKSLVSKRVLKAFDIILSPCCTNTITAVSAECADVTGYNVTVTFTGTTNLFGHGFGILYVDGVPVAVQGVYNDNGSITFESVPVSTGTSNVGLVMLMSTNNGEATQGVYVTSSIFADVDFPSCVR